MTATIYPANQGDSDDGKDVTKLYDRMMRDYKLAYDHPDWRKIRDEAELDDRCLSVQGPIKDADLAARQVKGEERPWVHLDQVSQYCNQLVNEALSNPIAIKAEPSGGKANEGTSKLRADRIRAIEYESDAQACVMTAFESMVRHSFGWFGIDVEYKSWDDFRQVIRYKEGLNSYAALWDPRAEKRDWSDIKFWFDLYRMPMEQFREEYPDATRTDFGSDLIEMGWADDDSVQVARYWYIQRDKRHLMLVEAPEFPGKPFKIIKEKIKDSVKLPDGREVSLEGYKITKDAIVLKDGTQWAIKDTKTDYEPTVYYCICSGSEILSEPELFPGKWIPRFPMVGKKYFEKHGNKVQLVIESYIRKARDGQLLFDYYASKESEDIAMIGVGPYRAAVGQVTENIEQWQTAHKIPRGVLEYDPCPDTVPNGTVLTAPSREIWTPNTQITEIGKESTRRAIQTAIGSYGVTRLDDTNVKSGIAMKELKAQNDMGSYHFMDALKTMVKAAGRVVNDLLDNIETDNMEVGLRNSKDEYTVKRINDGTPPNEDEPNTYKLTDEDQHEITISVGKSYQSQRQEDAEVGETLLSNIQAIAQIVGPEKATAIIASVLKMRQLGPDVEELIKLLMPEDKEKPNAKTMGAELQKWQGLANQLGQKIQQLEQEKASKLVEIQSKERIAEMEVKKDLAVAEIQTKAQKESERAVFIQDLVRALQSHQQEQAAAHMDFQRQRVMQQEQAQAQVPNESQGTQV